MARLPNNVDRIRDGRGYRFVAYGKDGYCIRLNNDGSGWTGYAVLTGAYVGRRKTLTAMGALCASFKVRTTYAEALQLRTFGLAAWNHTEHELANIIRTRRNQYGIRLTFSDGSAAFMRTGSAKVEVVK